MLTSVIWLFTDFSGWIRADYGELSGLFITK